MGKYPTQGQKERVAAILAESAARRGAAPSYEQNYRAGGSASRASIGRRNERKAAQYDKREGRTNRQLADAKIREFDSGGGFGFGDVLKAADFLRGTVVSGYEQGLHGVRSATNAAGITDEAYVEDPAKVQAQNYALSVLQDELGGKHTPDEINAAMPDRVHELSTQWLRENGHEIQARRAEAKWLNQGPSADDFAQGVSEHRTYGQVLSRAVGNDDGTITGNGAADFAIGMTGDVLLDPLAKIGPAKALEGSRQQVAARVLGSGADDAEGLAARVLTSGKSALNPEELQRTLGTTGGMKWRVPGSGKEVTVVPKGITDIINRPTAALTGKLGGSKAVSGLRKVLSGADPELEAAIRGGSTDALQAKRMVKTEGQAALHYEGEVRDAYAKMSRRFKKHGEDVVRALEGDESALARLDAAGVDAEELGGLISKLADDMKAAGVPLAEREQYFPRMLTPEARDATRTGQSLDGSTPFFLKGRTMVEGKVLRDGTKLSGPEFKIRDTVNRWAEENGLGKGFYEGNPDKVMPAYIAAVSKRIGKQKVINRLVGAGIARDAREAVTVIDQAAVKTIAQKAREAIRVGNRAEAYAQQSQGQADAAAALRGEAPPSAGELGGVESELAHLGSQDVPAQPDLADVLRQGTDAKAAVDNPQPFLPEMTRTEALDQAATEQAAAQAARAADAGVQYRVKRALETLKPETAPAPVVDDALMRKHDLLFRSPTRVMGFDQADPHKLSKYMDMLERAAKDSGDEAAARAVSNADAAFVRGDMGKFGAHAEEALTRIHDVASGTSLGARADELVQASKNVLPGTPEFESVSRRALDGLEQFVEHPDIDADGAARVVRDLIEPLPSGQVSPWATYSERQGFLQRFAAGDAEVGTAEHAQKMAIDRFDEAVEYLDQTTPGWRTRDQDVIFGPSPAGTPEFKGGPVVAADGAAGPAEHDAFSILDRIDAANVKMADVNEAITSEVQRAQQELGDVREKIADALDVVSEDDVLRQVEDLQSRRVALLEKVAKEENANARRAGVLEAKALEAQAKAAQYYKKGEAAVEVIAGTATKKQITRAIDELNTGAYKTLTAAPDVAAPADIADALNRVAKVNTPEGMRSFLKHYDSALNFIKAWQITTPGFHVRNFMGGMFNNYLADVPLTAYRDFLKDRKAWRAGAENPLMDELMGVISRGQYGADEISQGLHQGPTKFGVTLSPQSINPLSRKNAAIQASTEAGGRVEEILRGTLGYHTMKSGGSLDDAVEQIARFHFDYGDLSSFEKGTVKRIIPFYTWTRKNFPLQIEMMLTRPGKYAKYYQVKHNLELAAGPPEDIVPQYFGDLFAIHTPFKVGGNDAYLTPDLPFTQTMQSPLPIDTDGNLDPGGIASMVTPIIKTPVERAMNHQFFKNIPFTDKRQDVPSTWSSIPGFDQALRTAGLADRSGQITDRTAYTIEQYLPMLGRSRRLAPSEKKYEERGLSTFMSFIGVPIRVNTDYEKKMEKLRRALAMQADEDKRLGKTSSFTIHYKPKK